MEKIIKTFLEKFCTTVHKNESSHYIELMMDSHTCIKYKDVEYYVPENNMLYTEDDLLLYNFLIFTYQL